MDAQLPGPSLMPADAAAAAAVDEIINNSSSAFASSGLAMVGGRSGRWVLVPPEMPQLVTASVPCKMEQFLLAHE